MIRVLHFDYEPYTALGCVQMLEHRLKKYHSVDYMFLKTDIKSFEGSRKRIEELLPEKDVLLIHPGVEEQKAVTEYPSKFPHLKIAFLVPMPDDYHEKDGKIEAFGWGNLDAIIDFIL